MNLQDLMSMDKDAITCTEAGAVLKTNPQSIRTAARQRPDALGFPVICIGTRTLIPRIPFINFMTGTKGE